jgi:hypothetical protein
MDIKCPNILTDVTRRRYVVGDYDLAGPARPDKTARDYSTDMYWYYAAMGAEPNEPLYSWRMDLTALGYMLSAITWNRDEDADWKFYSECLKRREGKRSLEISDDELIVLRESEMSRVHVTMRTYFNMVAARVGWADSEPPPRRFYEELISLFH